MDELLNVANRFGMDVKKDQIIFNLLIISTKAIKKLSKDIVIKESSKKNKKRRGTKSCRKDRNSY